MFLDVLNGAIDIIYDILFSESNSTSNTTHKHHNIKSNNIKSLLSTITNIIDFNGEKGDEEESEYITYEGDGSEFTTERMELDEEYPFIKLSETDEDDNVFGKTLFRFRKNGPKYGCDVRLEPYYKIPEKFYIDKWGEEILTFTDILAGYIPLIEKARIIARDPGLYFGIKIYNDPDSFMLSSLSKTNKMTDDIIITVYDGKYEISFKRDL